MDHRELGDRYLADIAASRRVLADVAQELGFGFPSCPTNFQLLELPEGLDPAAVRDELKRKGYLVKAGFTAPSVRRCLRITLADADVMTGFAGALRGVLIARGDARER
jgi:histidinol-phosphate/aromatic aminotransferase/cobyric acid decarboxylase-like protein